MRDRTPLPAAESSPSSPPCVGKRFWVASYTSIVFVGTKNSMSVECLWLVIFTWSRVNPKDSEQVQMFRVWVDVCVYVCV